MSDRANAFLPRRHDMAAPPPRTLAKRLRDLTLLWALFGAVVGACPGLTHGGDALGILSGALAGVILTPVLGVLIALLGGQAKPTLLGAIGGAMVGVLARFVAGAPDGQLTAELGLLVGGMAGGTLPQMLRSTAFLARSVIAAGRGR
jgi:hypothetical protein